MRLFLALDLDPVLRDRLARLPGARVRPENLHLTLRFLGELLDPAPVARAAVTVAARHTRFTVAVGGSGTFGAHVAWVGVADDPRLRALADDLDAALAALGLAPRDKPFAPHITVSRARRRKRVDARVAEAARAVSGTLVVDAVVLFRSDPRDGGAVYTAIARAPLST